MVLVSFDLGMSGASALSRTRYILFLLLFFLFLAVRLDRVQEVANNSLRVVAYSTELRSESCCGHRQRFLA